VFGIAEGARAFKTHPPWRWQGEQMRFPTKVAIVVREELAVWQKLNVTAFLTSGIAHATGEIMGQPYVDGSDNVYLSMLREPVMVYAAGANGLTTVHERALRRGLAMAIYTEELFATGNDDDNRAAVRAVTVDKLNLVGVAVYGARNEVDKVVKGLSLHT
jgi:hypothetical protein